MDDQFKIKIPFSGSGPLEVKIKKDGKDLVEDDRLKISVFDDYVVLMIKGKSVYLKSAKVTFVIYETSML